MRVNKLIVGFMLLMFAGLASAGTLSVDQIQFDSESRVGDTGQAIIITTTADGEAQSYQLYRDSDFFSEQLGKEVDSSLTMRLDNLFTFAEYPIEESGQESPHTISIQKHEYQTPDVDTSQDGWKDQVINEISQKAHEDGCIQSDDGTFYGAVRSTIKWTPFPKIYTQVYCAHKEKTLASGVSDFRAPVEHYNVDVEMDNGQGRVCSETITTEGRGNGQTTYLCDRDIRVDTEGGLETPTPAPETGNLYIAHDDSWSNNGFRVIEEESYQDWEENFNTLSYDIDNAIGTGQLDRVSSTFNEDAKQAVSWADDGLWSQRSELEFRGNMDDGSVELVSWPGSGQLVRPVLTITAESGPDSFIVVKETSGEPDIIDVSKEELADSSSAAFDVKVKNIGDAPGQFEVRTESCTEDFDPVSAGKYINLGSGEQETLTFVVSGSATDGSNTIDGSCTFAAQDTVSQKIDRMSGSITLNQNQKCDPGEKSKGLGTNEKGDTVWTIFECDDNGRGYSADQYCKKDQKVAINNGQYSCIKAPGSGNGDTDTGCGQWNFGITTTPDYLCQFENVAKGGLALASFIGMMIIVPGMLRKTPIPKRVQLAGGFIAGIIFAGLSWFAFWLVFSALIILVLMAIIIEMLNPFG